MRNLTGGLKPFFECDTIDVTGADGVRTEIVIQKPKVYRWGMSAGEAFRSAFSIHHPTGGLWENNGSDEVRYLDCRGCGNEVELLDNTGQCEWCGRRYAEEGDNGKM